MKKIIKIDIMEKDDLIEKYNRKQASKDLMSYIVETLSDFNKKDEFKIVINNKFKEVNSKEIIIEGLKKENYKSLKNHLHNNIVQIIYLIVGIIMIFLSTLIKDSVLSEIVLIGGWVFVWAMVEIEIFTDVKGRRKRKILKKILNSEIIENIIIE